jgi:hypothetical protein
MITKITRKDAESTLEIYPRINLGVMKHNNNDYITIGSYVEMHREGKTYLGYIRKEYKEDGTFEIERLINFLTLFDIEANRMSYRGIVMDNDVSNYYLIEDE